MNADAKKKLYIILGIAAALVTLASGYILFTRTQAAYMIQGSTGRYMIIELLVMFIWLFVSLYFLRNSYAGRFLLLLSIYVFLWLHRIAVPVFISGIYVLYLVILGMSFLKLCRVKLSEYAIVRGAQSLGSGIALQLIVFAALAAFGIGGVKTLRIASVVLAVISAAVLYLISKKRDDFGGMEILPSDTELNDEEKNRLPICLALALMMTMFLLQAGRINTALDYDTLHYAARSQFVLDGGNGFFENMGSVNGVYIYPKGLELLLMPLCSDITYGYVISFSWWMTIGTVALVYHIVRSIATRKKAIYAATAMSVIPAIMNMACSAKTDATGLCIQLAAIMFILNYLEERKPDRLVFALAFLCLSLCFKPTSYLFSSLILITGIIFIIADSRRQRLSAEANADSRKQNTAAGANEVTLHTARSSEVLHPGQTIAIILPAMLAFIAICARTLILTGHPVVGFGTFIWNALGFRLKYPFVSIDAFTSPSEGISLRDVVERLIGIFVCPKGDLNDHVIIAWGSTLPTVAAGMVLLDSLISGRKNKKADGRVRFLKALLIVLLVAAICCITFLNQVDGNYFMLMYAASIICFFVSDIDSNIIIIPAVLATVMCMASNWAGVPGMTPTAAFHGGYFDHEEANYNSCIRDGSGDIYLFLQRDKNCRVIAFAEQPHCEIMQCNIQSYLDIEGSFGNVYLLKKLDYFKEYLDYAKTDYIYVDEAFYPDDSRADEIIYYMVDEGSLTELIRNEDKVLYQYNRGK